jgi:glucose/arabinose dehydrogenase
MMRSERANLPTTQSRDGGARRRSGPRRALNLAVFLLASHALVGANCERNVKTVQVGGTFNSPIFVTAPIGDPRVFVVERAGTIRVIDENDNVLPTPFLDITSKVGTAGESGLLGMAFSPNYANNGGQFYVYYLNAAGDSVLSRFLRSPSNPNVAGTTERVLLTVDQPAGRTNHKGGTIAFSPVDGMLYWALGDGGGGNDPDNLAQNPQSLLGKMLRLNVGGGASSGYTIPADNPFVGPDGVLDEIWSLGFRNPFRWSFDRQLGDLWVGDVGQGDREEVDFEPASDPGGRNYGWKVHEGSLCHLPQPGNPCETPATASVFTFPFYEYATHVNGTCSITGGVVYRGSVSFLKGAYLFADWCSNRIWSLGGTAVGLMDLTAPLAPTSGSIAGIVAFGEDGFGEVYIVSGSNGLIFRIE